MGRDRRRRSQSRAGAIRQLPAGQAAGRIASQDSGVAWASVGLPNLATPRRARRSGERSGQARHHLQAFDPGRRNIFGDLAEHLFGNRNARPARSGALRCAADDAAGARRPRRRRSGTATTRSNSTCCRPAPASAPASTAASNDPLTHNTLSADQKLYGPLHVTTAVTDLGQPSASRSIRAGLTLNW